MNFDQAEREVREWKKKILKLRKEPQHQNESEPLTKRPIRVLSQEEIDNLKSKRLKQLNTIIDSNQYKRLKNLCQTFEFIDAEISLPDIYSNICQQHWENELKSAKDCIHELFLNMFTNKEYLQNKIKSEIQAFRNDSIFYKQHPNPEKPPSIHLIDPDEAAYALKIWKDKIIKKVVEIQTLNENDIQEIIELEEYEPVLKRLKPVAKNLNIENQWHDDFKRSIESFKQSDVYEDCKIRPKTPAPNDYKTELEALNGLQVWKDKLIENLLNQLKEHEKDKKSKEVETIKNDEVTQEAMSESNLIEMDQVLQMEPSKQLLEYVEYVSHTYILALQTK